MRSELNVKDAEMVTASVQEEMKKDDDNAKFRELCSMAEGGEDSEGNEGAEQTS